jgi:hypothetical protein
MLCQCHAIFGVLPEQGWRWCMDAWMQQSLQDYKYIAVYVDDLFIASNTPHLKAGVSFFLKL